MAYSRLTRHRRTRGHCPTALKVYSEEPIDSRTWQRLYQSAVSRDIAANDVSARSILERLLAAAIKPHAALRSARNVFYQLLSPSAASPVRATRQDRHQRRKQSWNLLFVLHRSQADSSALCRPRVQVRINPFDFEKPCSITSGAAAWRPVFALELGGHVKAGLMTAGVAGEVLVGQPAPSPSPSLEQALSALVAQAAGSVKGGVYEDVGDLLPIMKDSVMRWLPRSAIAEVIDFNDLEIVITDRFQGRRFVLLTMLHPDGSERALVSGIKSDRTLQSDDPPQLPRQEERSDIDRRVGVSCHGMDS